MKLDQRRGRLGIINRRESQRMWRLLYRPLLVVAMVGSGTVGWTQETTAPASARWGDPRADALIARGLNAVRAGATSRALAASGTLKAKYPAEPARLVIDFALALAQFQAGPAAALFTRMAAETPRQLAAPLPLLAPDQVAEVMQISTGKDAARVARAVVAANWSSGPGDFELINARRTLIDAALASGDVQEARAFASQNDNTFSVRDYAILDKYKPLHADLIARWGANLAGVAERERSMWNRLAAQPGHSLVILTEQGRWQIVDGHPEAAVASMMPAVEQAFSDTIAEHRFPFVDVAAQALARVGRGNEALALYDRFRRSVPKTADSYRDAAFAEIMLLGNMGRAAEALAQAHVAQESFGKALPALLPSLYRFDICAAADIGDRARANQKMTALLASNGYPTWKVQALICLDRIDEAAAVTVAAMQRRTGVDVLRRLQIEPSPLWGAWRRRWDKGYATLRKRPDVQAAVNGFGTIRSIGFPDIDNL